MVKQNKEYEVHIEKQMLTKALEKANWNKTRAANILGITRRAIYSRMQKHGLA